MPTSIEPPTASSTPPTGGSRGSRGVASTADAGRGLCVFDLAAGRFGLDVASVAEVISVARPIAVPRAPHGVIGLVNLRGIAVAVVDLAVVLDMPHADLVGQRATTAVVLRTGNTLLAAIEVRAVVTVVPTGLDQLRPANRDSDHPAVLGFATTIKTGVVSVLDTAYVHQRLAALRPR